MRRRNSAIDDLRRYIRGRSALDDARSALRGGNRKLKKTMEIIEYVASLGILSVSMADLAKMNYPEETEANLIQAHNDLLEIASNLEDAIENGRTHLQKAVNMLAEEIEED